MSWGCGEQKRWSHKERKRKNWCCSFHKSKWWNKKNNQNQVSIYAEFIRTFVFPSRPIVQPGESVPFPIPTVLPLGITYVDEPGRVGALVPSGIYRVSWQLNPEPIGASVTLLVNGLLPQTLPPFAYTQQIVDGTAYINAEYLITAPFPQNNLISLVNAGTSLFSLADLPNTKIGDVSILTHVLIQRIGPVQL